MTPLFFFLASSLNVELVYIILKGITQFAYINKGNSKKFMKIQFIEEDCVVTLNKIKIKDP